ncbi:hypothetical protein EB796_006709 [Bugula neritina]|uniref:Uncharacterized protein n=1 Tax=Bugula neritina TaxID=10212 RepID=A0A7J7K9T1_BUGNE|nr:hypothetical protein EB796_006709 [Bugula neritina]
MASNTASKSARTRVIQAFQLTVECGICTNVRELRLLPCQHMMCAPCLGLFLVLKYQSKHAFIILLQIWS